ncbi:MAG: PAS domain S-box protein, partial [Verrucomicrobia subdivision 3 bacterium]|nr:PAS domain S-box protein [Limisphaerales bacterium]
MEEKIYPSNAVAPHRAEDILRESEARLEMFFSQSLDGFFFMMLDEPVRWDETIDKEKVLDYVFAHQRITKVNEAMLAQYGATREQFLGLTPGDFYQHNLAHGREVWRRFFDAGRLHVETDERKLDGTSMSIEGDYICFYDSEGRITGHFGIQRDVTGRKRAEAALRQYNRRLKTSQEIDRAILAARSPAQIAQATLRHIHELVPCLRASVAVFDFMAGKAVLIAIHAKAPTELGVGTQLSLEAFGDIGQLRLGKVHVVEDTETFSPPSETVASVRSEGVRAYINVPLRAQGELIGVLNLGSERPGQFSGEQIEITQEVANSLAVAIRQARLYEQIEQHANELEQRVAERTVALSAANASLKNEIAERERIEAVLRENEERYRSLYNNTPVMLHSIDSEKKLVSVNDFWLKTLGYERHEVIGRRVTDFLTEASRRFALEVGFPKLFQTGSLKDVEVQFVKKSGDVIDVLVSALLKRDEQGKLLWTLAFLLDVTERKRIEQALRESEERYRALYDEAPIAYFSVGIDSRIRQANKRAAELLGCPMPELLGRSTFDFIADTPLGKPKAQKLLQKLLAGEEVRSEELELRRANGEQVWVLLSFKPILDEQGKVIADRSQLEDITARKRLEEALQRYSEKLQELVDERTAQLRQSEERQRALLEINNAIISNLDRDSLFAAIAKTLRSILSFDRLSLYIYDPASDLLKGFAATGIAAQKTTLGVGIDVPRQGSLMGRAVDEKRPIIGRDLRDERPASVDAGIIAKLIELGIRSLLTLPLITKGKVIGVLNFTSLTPDQYSERDAEFLQEIAKQVALAVENMQAYEEIAQLKARLEQENIYLQEEIKTQHNFEEIIGRSQAIKKVLQAVETV